MYGICKRAGFTFIEIVVVLLIIGTLATVVFPALSRRGPAQRRDEFFSTLNALTRRAWQQALVTHAVHRLFFDLQKRTVRVEKQTSKKDAEGKYIYQEAAAPYLKSSYQWPEGIEIRQFFIEGEDVLTRPGMKIFTAWFFIVPSGLSQSVILNSVDMNDKDNKGEPLRMSWVINPFYAQYKQYEEFQKP